MGEGKREKREGRAASLVGFDGPWDETRVEHLDHGLRQSFGQVGHPVADTERGQVGIQFSDTLVAVSLIYGNLQRRNNRFRVQISCLYQVLQHDLFFGCLRLGSFLCSGFVFSRREKLAAERLSYPPKWSSLIGQEVRLLSHTALQFGLVLTIYKQLTFLARAEFVQTQLFEHMTRQQMSESELYATQIWIFF